MTFWCGSGSGSADPCLWLMDPYPAIFVILILCFIFSAYYFLKVHLHLFSKIKSQKESQNSKNQVFLHQCCGSGMFIPDPGSWFLPIPDPGSKNSNKREGWKKICCHNFLCSHKFHNFANCFSFEVLKKKIWANFQRIIEIFTQKIVTKLSKISIWDPGSGKKPIPDPGSRIQGSKRHRIPDPGSGTATLFRMMIEGSRSGAGSIPLTNGSGSGSRRPKNIWIRIRIRNTVFLLFFFIQGCVLLLRLKTAGL